MRNIKAIIEYQGTDFKGFQIQPQTRTVQGALENVLYTLTQERIKVMGAGRTDAGVHALGQVVNFFTQSKLPVQRFPLALNSCLPSDIRVLDVAEMPADFHARYSAKEKTYCYLLRWDLPGAVFWRNQSLLLSEAIDYKAMQVAASYLVGTYDFRSFCASGSKVQNMVRTISKCSFQEDCFGWKFEVTADGFLYRMVRNLVGTLLQVGEGRRYPEDLPKILASGDRNQAGPTAPPQGLYLVKVDY